MLRSHEKRDHGGGLDEAARIFGGTRSDWLDLSTGINATPYPFTHPPADAWTDLPDSGAYDALNDAARRFWDVPDAAAVLATPGLSAAIAQIPRLAPPGRVNIPTPTYNEHAASFAAAGWQVSDENPTAQVLVHPNNPDGYVWRKTDLTAPLRIIDESFCDLMPDRSLIDHAADGRTLVLKSFGKFWGLAGLRLGFVIGSNDHIERLASMLGPWPVSGPALSIGTEALADVDWATAQRASLQTDAARIDRLFTDAGATVTGGTDLFRLYTVDNAAAWQERLATHQIWTRIFPYSGTWLRVGLPPASGWDRLEAAL
ncbi:MAG: threonine-phosphate decarboxylase [Pseudomonadota bacterium]